MSDRPKPVGLPGIRARAVRGPRADGRWYWRVERSSTADKAVLACIWATPAEASRRVAEVLASGAATAPQAEVAELATVDELLGAYVAHLEDTRPDLARGTMQVYRLRRRQVWAVGLGTMRLARLQAADVEVMRATLLRTLGPRTVLGILVHVGTAWRWARREGAVPDRELVIPAVKVPSKVRTTPSAKEIESILGALGQPWQRLAVILLWSTGCRIGEIASLTWSRVDLSAGEIVVAGKTGQRRIPLTPRALAALREARIAAGDAERVLSVTDTTCRNQLGLALQAAAKSLGLQVWTPHGLRRAAVDALARSGVDVSTAAALLGHSPQVMLTHYRQVTSTDLRDAVARAELGTVPRAPAEGSTRRR